MSVPDPALTDWVPLATLGGGGVDYKGAYSAATTYAAGDVVRYNGVDYLAVNPSTGQTPGTASGSASIGTSLPASPVNDQEFTLVDSLTAPTYSWKFKYVAGIGDAYKWMFVGGSNLKTEVGGTLAVAGATPYISIGPVILTVPRSGIYDIGMFVSINFASNDTGVFSISIAGVVPVDTDGMYVSGYGSTWESVYRELQKTLVASSTLELKYKWLATYGGSTLRERRLSIIPVRVS